ncbi:hypothetical protein RB195_001792 [Necator americanus]|uniref:Leucine Rich repeat-containing domain protein n=1 Tax=Necator americanus TaxID=51031 RepID=A0ABR1DIT6_NECAM
MKSGEDKCQTKKLNTTNLDSLKRPEIVRTLTIRCPHFSKKKSTPAAGLFRGLHKLYSLIIKNARLPTIPNDLFAHTPNLMTLDMSGNELRIEPYSLKSLSNLIHLDLSNNSINFLANTLISLTKLNVLTMDHNKLTNVDFRRLPEELSDLSLRHNFITTLHYAPPSVRNLRRIDLSGNMLEFISGSGSVNMLPAGLKQADLSNNRISFVQDGALSLMEKLALLDLKGNQLTELKETTMAGPRTRLRLFLEGNPLKCHCGLRWLLHAKSKTSPVVLDLPRLSCSLLLDENQRLNLTIADQLNQLICKYERFCPESCSCCEEVKCSCRSECPQQCQCYRSSNMERLRNAQNIAICEKLRFDHLSALPESITELRIDTADWNQWDVGKLQNLRMLSTLRLLNTPITDDEVNTLSSLKSLTHLQLSSTSITKVPSQMGHLSQLLLAGNPLLQLSAENLKVLDQVKKVSLGGNYTHFTCDCNSPSPLQLWLREKRNRDKSFGTVTVLSTLPTNDSLCHEETIDTTQWIEFVTNIERNGKRSDSTKKAITTRSYEETLRPDSIIDVNDRNSNEMSPSSPVPDQPLSSSQIAYRSRSLTGRYVTSTVSSTNSTTQLTITTPRQRRKYQRDNNPDKFLNALIFVLFACVLILVVAIAFTLYFRFIRIDSSRKPQKRLPEAMPLNVSA